jgi:hypothetical protein
LKKKEEDTDGEFDVYCVRKRFSFRVSRVRKFGRRSVGVCARSTRSPRGGDTERKRSAVAGKERTRRSSEKKKDFSSRTVDVMAVGRACARADRAPASSTSAAMVRRSPGGSEAMLSAVHAVTPGVNPVTPPGCSMVPARTDAGGDERSSGLSTTGTLAGITWTASAARATTPRASAAARARATTGPAVPRRAKCARGGGADDAASFGKSSSFSSSVDGEREVRVKKRW